MDEDEDYETQDEDRFEYLRSSKAVPTDKALYALWVEIYTRQGGKLVERDKYSARYWQSVGVEDENGNVWMNPSDEPITEYSWADRGIRSWTPTVLGHIIPTGYGASGMTITYFTEDGRYYQPEPSSHYYDTRPGWEWGHTMVYVIYPDPTSKTGFGAYTNDDHILTHDDIEDLRGKLGLKGLLKYTGMKKAGAFSWLLGK